MHPRIFTRTKHSYSQAVQHPKEGSSHGYHNSHSHYPKSVHNRQSKQEGIVFGSGSSSYLRAARNFTDASQNNNTRGTCSGVFVTKLLWIFTQDTRSSQRSYLQNITLTARSTSHAIGMSELCFLIPVFGLSILGSNLSTVERSRLLLEHCFFKIVGLLIFS